MDLVRPSRNPSFFPLLHNFFPEKRFSFYGDLLAFLSSVELIK